MKFVFLVSIALLIASCGDDGPDVTPTNNSGQNNKSNNNHSNNGESNNPLNNPTNNETNGSTNNETNGSSNNETNGSSNNETNNSTCIPSAGGIDICDGRDNDCDGDIDEEYDVGEACLEGVGACETMGMMVCDDQVSTKCDAVPGTPSTEMCDGTDNDCDGEVDEGFGLGVACSAGEGACANDGVVACLPDGTAACNAVAGVPGGAELCNAMDDDCDGVIDEDFPTLGQSCTVGLGVCAATGANVCSGDELSVVCSATAGTPTAEVCDGLDNDCDGDVDEDFPTLGQPCSVGVGACAASGVYVCSGDQLGVVCSAVAGTPTAEVCDGVDNDCDGDVDEGFNLGQACSEGLGVCQRSGQIACQGNGTSACSVVAGAPQEGSETICDGLDNDCDGMVDENCDEDNDGYCKQGFTRVGTPAVCPLGENDCNDNDPDINPGATEVCDGVDNNCSGSIDIGAVDANTYYVDCDGDNYAAGTANSQQACSSPANSLAQSFCGAGNSARWVTLAPTGNNLDCQDQNANVRPNQTSYFSTAMSNPPTPQRNFDYNCDGTNEKQETTMFVSTTDPCPDTGYLPLPAVCLPPPSGTDGWVEFAPACGSTDAFTFCSYSRIGTTNSCSGTRQTIQKTQNCR